MQSLGLSRLDVMGCDVMQYLAIFSNLRTTLEYEVFRWVLVARILIVTSFRLRVNLIVWNEPGIVTWLKWTRKVVCLIAFLLEYYFSRIVIHQMSCTMTVSRMTYRPMYQYLISMTSFNGLLENFQRVYVTSDVKCVPLSIAPHVGV